MNYPVHTRSIDHLFLREGTTYRRIPLSDISYIEADGNYANIQTKHGRYSVKRSLATISDELEQDTFVRVSRGLLVNFEQVHSVSFADGVLMLGDEELKIGKAYHAEIKQHMPRL